MRKRKSRGAFKRLACLVLTGIMLFGEGTAFGSFGGGLAAEKVSAAEAKVIRPWNIMMRLTEPHRRKQE